MAKLHNTPTVTSIDSQPIEICVCRISKLAKNTFAYVVYILDYRRADVKVDMFQQTCDLTTRMRCAHEIRWDFVLS